jgi:hypothetical protein
VFLLDGACSDIDVFEVMVLVLVMMLVSESKDGLLGIGRKITWDETVWGARDAVCVGGREGRGEKVEMGVHRRRRGRASMDRPWSEIVGHRHLFSVVVGKRE